MSDFQISYSAYAYNRSQGRVWWESFFKSVSSVRKYAWTRTVTNYIERTKMAADPFEIVRYLHLIYTAWRGRYMETDDMSTLSRAN